MSAETAPRVFVETNFLLELAFDQEQARDCEALLELAEQRKITLLFPAFSLFEAHDTIARRAIDWSNHLDPLTRIVFREGARMASLQAEARSLGAGFGNLLNIIKTEPVRRLKHFASRATAAGKVLPMESQTLVLADHYLNELGLKLPDAVVLATIVEGLRAEPGDAIFASRDTDFHPSQIRGELQSHSCKLLPSFHNAHQRLLHAPPRA